MLQRTLPAGFIAPCLPTKTKEPYEEMPGDPKECRQHALTCAELAEKADSPARAQIFKNLASQWLKLAVELERAQALMDEYEARPLKR